MHFGDFTLCLKPSFLSKNYIVESQFGQQSREKNFTKSGLYCIASFWGEIYLNIFNFYRN